MFSFGAVLVLFLSLVIQSRLRVLRRRPTLCALSWLYRPVTLAGRWGLPPGLLLVRLLPRHLGDWAFMSANGTTRLCFNGLLFGWAPLRSRTRISFCGSAFPPFPPVGVWFGFSLAAWLLPALRCSWLLRLSRSPRAFLASRVSEASPWFRFVWAVPLLACFDTSANETRRCRSAGTLEKQLYRVCRQQKKQKKTKKQKR